MWTTRSVDEVRAALPAEVRTSLVLERDTVFDVAKLPVGGWVRPLFVRANPAQVVRLAT